MSDDMTFILHSRDLVQCSQPFCSRGPVHA